MCEKVLHVVEKSAFHFTLGTVPIPVLAFSLSVIVATTSFIVGLSHSSLYTSTSERQETVLKMWCVVFSDTDSVPGARRYPEQSARSIM